jgi:hypothetical protein
MRRSLTRLITTMQLTRLTMAFGAVADVWFIVLLTLAAGSWNTAVELPLHEMDLALALLAGAAVAVGLFAYGASLNDLLDARHDSAFSPDRPIPAGRIRPGQATVVTISALIVSMLAADAFGSPGLWIAVLTAAAVLFYNAAGKYIPAVGVVTIGIIHAAHMLIPNEHLAFMLPVWLVMTHTMAIAAAVHVLEDKRPRLTRRQIAGAAAGWAFWSGAILLGGALRMGGLWPEGVNPIGLALPALAALAFVTVALWKTRQVSGRRAAEKLKRYGAMWQCLYGAAWLAALGLETQAIWLGILALAGFAGMTLIKEAMGLTGQPIAYRA